MDLDARAIPCFPADLEFDDALRRLAAAQGFAAAIGSVLLVSRDMPTLLVGCGDPSELTEESLRIAFAAAGRELAHLGSVEVDTELLSARVIGPEFVDRPVAEGLLLGSYRFDLHQTQRSPRTSWIPADRTPAWDEGVAIAEAVNAVRDVVNEPANVVTPRTLAERFERIGDNSGLTVVVRDEEWLAQAGAGGILAIGRGSAQRPVLVEMVHEGDGGPVDLCLVGKGVTYDSGGLSLKDPSGLMYMQLDMAGAATVAHAMSFLASVAPSLHVRAFLPLVENMPGPDAARPGDIVTAHDGTTIELLNIDFEGRVIMADALAFAAEHEPRHIIDIATLTHGAQIALGARIGALFGSGEAPGLVAAAAETSGEQVWELPMPEYLMPTIRSRVADLKNFPHEPLARAATAAMFLREFVPDGSSWAHIDMAGPGWVPEAYGINPVGATGWGVRLFVDLFRQLDAAKAAGD